MYFEVKVKAASLKGVFRGSNAKSKEGLICFRNKMQQAMYV